MIIDAKVPREPAKEMVMLMNGYNLKDDYSKESEMTALPPLQSYVPTLLKQLGQTKAVTRFILSMALPSYTEITPYS